jgi:hypothetical protein
MGTKPVAVLSAGFIFAFMFYHLNGYCQEPVGGSSPGSEGPPAASQPPAAATESTLEQCQDGLDNDGDAYIDCKDQDCWIFVACQGADKPSSAQPAVPPAPPAAAAPDEGGRVDFVSDKPGVSVRKVVAEGFYSMGTASGYAMMTTGECLTPCSFHIQKGTAQKFIIGRGFGGRALRVDASDLLLTYKVRKNYPALFFTGIIGVSTGPVLILLAVLLSTFETRNIDTGKDEPLVGTGAAIGMGVAGGALLVYGIMGLAFGIARVRKVD